MENQTFTNVRKLTTSGIVIALYVIILFMTQSFSFGAYQIRIVTSLYALSYLFPFLVIPLGLANRRHCNIWYCHADQKIPPAAFYDLFPDHACTGPWCRTMAVTYGPHALWGTGT